MQSALFSGLTKAEKSSHTKRSPLAISHHQQAKFQIASIPPISTPHYPAESSHLGRVVFVPLAGIHGLSHSSTEALEPTTRRPTAKVTARSPCGAVCCWCVVVKTRHYSSQPASRAVELSQPAHRQVGELYVPTVNARVML